jgi:hypothetical protein
MVSASLNICVAVGNAARFALLLALANLCNISEKFDLIDGLGISGGGFFFVKVKRAARGVLVMRHLYKMQARRFNAQDCRAGAALNGLHNSRGGFGAACGGVDYGLCSFYCVRLRGHGLGSCVGVPVASLTWYVAL